MAIYPEAIYRPLTVPRRAEANSPIALVQPTLIDCHTAVSNSRYLDFFNTSGAGGVFSHFYVNKYGEVIQFQDTKYRATCDLDANPRSISIESWDGFGDIWGDGDAVPPYNTAQREAMVKLLNWLFEVHPSLDQRMARDNSSSGLTGIGWHRIGIEPYAKYTRSQRGLYTSLRTGKICPGDNKIAQLPGILRDAKEVESMALSDEDIKRIWSYKVPWMPGKKMSVSLVPFWLRYRLDKILTKLGVIEQIADVDEEAMAQSVIDQLAPDIRAAISDSLVDALEGIDEDRAGAISDLVIDKLGDRIVGGKTVV